MYVCLHILKFFKILLTEAKMIQIYAGGIPYGEAKYMNTKIQRTGTNGITLLWGLYTVVEIL